MLFSILVPANAGPLLQARLTLTGADTLKRPFSETVLTPMMSRLSVNHYWQPLAIIGQAIGSVA